MSSVWQLTAALSVGVAFGWWLHPDVVLPPVPLPKPVTAVVPAPILKQTMQPAVVVAPPTSLPPSPKVPLPSYLTLLEKGQIDRAIAAVQATPKSRQTQARTTMVHLATVLLNDHHTDGAMALLTPYHHQWPQDVAASRLLARSMLDSGQFEPAMALLNATLSRAATPEVRLSIQQQLDTAVAGYDTVLRQQDQRNKLLALYRQLAASDGNNARYQLKQAELLIEMGQTTEASALLQPLLFASASTADAARLLQIKIDQQLAQSFSDTIALTRLRNHFLVPITLADRTLMLLLDTGASLTLVPKTVANRYPAASPATAITLATANGTIRVPTMVVPTLVLGAQTLHHISVALTDNMGIQEADGLLGMDILKRFHFVIDQEHATLRLTPRVAAALPKR